MKQIMSILCVSACMVTAEVPSFNNAGEIKANNASIKISHASPCVADWNDDGKNDLLIGQFDDGKIKVFLNTGTAKAPVLQSSSFLKAGGADISLSSG